MTGKNNKNTRKIQKANNKSFEILELYEDGPIIFCNNSDRNYSDVIKKYCPTCK